MGRGLGRGGGAKSEGVFGGKGTWAGVCVKGKGLGGGNFRGVSYLGRGSGCWSSGVRWEEGFGGFSRVGDGDGGSWVPLLSVEDPLALSSFLFALCIDISVEDGGDFSGDSVHSFTLL